MPQGNRPSVRPNVCAKKRHLHAGMQRTVHQQRAQMQRKMRAEHAKSLRTVLHAGGRHLSAGVQNRDRVHGADEKMREFVHREERHDTARGGGSVPANVSLLQWEMCKSSAAQVQRRLRQGEGGKGSAGMYELVHHESSLLQLRYQHKNRNYVV